MRVPTVWVRIPPGALCVTTERQRRANGGHRERREGVGLITRRVAWAAIAVLAPRPLRPPRSRRCLSTHKDAAIAQLEEAADSRSIRLQVRLLLAASEKADTEIRPPRHGRFAQPVGQRSRKPSRSNAWRFESSTFRFFGIGHLSFGHWSLRGGWVGRVVNAPRC